MRTDKSMKAIAFGTRKITYNLHREERKRLRIVVAPELTVDIFAPATADEDQIQAAVMKKAAWIAGKLDAERPPARIGKDAHVTERAIERHDLAVVRGGEEPTVKAGRYVLGAGVAAEWRSFQCGQTIVG